LKAGETVVFRVEEGRPIAVRSGGPPAAGQLRASLTYNGGRTVLHVINNSGTPLNYQAMRVLPGNRLRRTAVCTVMPDRQGRHESWPQRVPQVVVYGFAPAKAGEFSCE